MIILYKGARGRGKTLSIVKEYMDLRDKLIPLCDKQILYLKNKIREFKI